VNVTGASAAFDGIVDIVAAIATVTSRLDQPYRRM
jgi:hypothetical protein